MSVLSRHWLFCTDRCPHHGSPTGTAGEIKEEVRMEDIETASRRYLRLGHQERTHADYCPRGGWRNTWRCWVGFGRGVEAASVALDVALSVAHPTLPGWRSVQEAAWERRAEDEIRAGLVI